MTMKTPTPTPASPCRLSVFLARDAPIGVILRRGPSAWARLSLWHTDTDAVEHGQWLHSRVHERRCDLSDDGRLFLAFVSGAPRATHEGGADSWLTISRPPWFTALALWFVGGTYFTGGLFPNAASVWLGFSSVTPDRGRLPDWLQVQTDPPPFIDRTNEWTTRTVFINRLLRHGWEPVAGGTPETWQRVNPVGAAILRMSQRTDRDFGAFGGPFALTYDLLSTTGATPIPIGRATWADWDQHGRLIVAQGGRLLHWEGQDRVHEIADFNGQSTDPAPAPDWATVWPPPPR